jgi:hypothetical protein
MWTSLSREDLRRAKDKIERRRVEVEARQREELKSIQAKHAEECNSLEAKLAELDEIERLIEAFVGEYLRGDGLTEPTAAEATAHTMEPLPKPEPVEVDVIATNWGNARFMPAEAIPGSKPHKNWGE